MLMRPTPWFVCAGPSPEGPPGCASSPGCCSAPDSSCPPVCGCSPAYTCEDGGGGADSRCPISIGAPGCSDGPGPSPVVWACRLVKSAPANARVKIAKLDLSL